MVTQSKIQSTKCKIALILFLVFASPTLADTVHFRDDLPPVQGKVLAIDDAGVRVEQGLQRAMLIRLDQVRDIEMESADPKLQHYLDLALNLWRARTRLERQDASLAEPAFERLFETYRGQTNEVAMLVAEGLLRCRLARGAHEAAVIPALECARLQRRLQQSQPVFSTLPPVLDVTTSLCMMLPPVWNVSPGLTKLHRDLQAYRPDDDAVVQSIAAMYLQAVTDVLNVKSENTSLLTTDDHPGVTLFRSLLAATSNDPTVRAAAQQSLIASVPSSPPWAQAWMHYFSGISRLMDTDHAERERGLVELAHLPARHRHQPYLVGFALAKIAEACDADGNSTAAAALRHELTTHYPNHPALTTRRSSPSTPAPAAEPFEESS